MSCKSVTIDKSRLIVCEGITDQRLLEKQLASLGLDSIQIIHGEGKDDIPGLLHLIHTRETAIQIDAILVIRDADYEPSNSFLAIQNALRNCGWVAPDELETFTDSEPKIAVMLLPNRFQIGELEDLCKSAVSNDELDPCICGLFDCVREKGIKDITHPAKSYMQVWSAIRFEGGRPFHQSIHEDSFTPHLESTVFSNLRKLLVQLSTV